MGNFIFKEESKVYNDVKYDDIKDNDIDDVKEETNDDIDDVKEETNDDVDYVDNVDDINDMNNMNAYNCAMIIKRDIEEGVRTGRELFVAHGKEWMYDEVMKTYEAEKKDLKKKEERADKEHKKLLKQKEKREIEEMEIGRQQNAYFQSVAQGAKGPSRQFMQEAIMKHREAKKKEEEERALMREQREIAAYKDFLQKKGIYPNVEPLVEVYKDLHTKFSGSSTSDQINEIMTSFHRVIVHDLRVLDCPDFIQRSKNKVKPMDGNNDNIETCYACKKEFVCPHDTTDGCKYWSCAEKEFGEYPISRMHTNSNLETIHVHVCSRGCDEILSEEYRTMLRNRGVNVIVMDDEDDYLSDD